MQDQGDRAPRGRSVVLTHFCETHGPSVIFTTQAVPLSSVPPNINITYLPSPLQSQTPKDSLNGVGEQQQQQHQHQHQQQQQNNQDQQQNQQDRNQQDQNQRDQRDQQDQQYEQNQQEQQNQQDQQQNKQENQQNQQEQVQPPTNGTTTNGTATTDGTATSNDVPVDTSCPTCRSVPDGAGLMSYDSDNPSLCYISSHNPPASTYALTRTACVRSLSCEVAPRDGPILFTSGSPEGEGQEWGVVSYVFRLADGQARGASRMYGLLLLLDDPSLLVSLLPWLHPALKQVILDLQLRANKYGQARPSHPAGAGAAVQLGRDASYRRAMRRTTTLRPLQDLLADKEFFHKLHERFCWIMQACIRRVGMRMYRIPHIVEDAPTAVHAGTAVPLATIVNCLGLDGFHTVLFNVLVGNQLVIRSDLLEQAASLGYTLSLVPPAGCGVTVKHFTMYLHSYAAPILVLPSHTALPSHADLDPADYVLVDIVGGSDSNQKPVYTVKGISETTTLGQAIEKIIDDNKAKEDSRLTLLTEEWTAKAKGYARLRSLIASATDPRLKTFSKALALSHEAADLRVLAFWATGLRQSVLVKDVV